MKLKSPFRNDVNEERLDRLERALIEHFRTEWTKAHPRNGDPEEVKRYLGV